MSTEEFEKIVKDWIAAAKHSVTKRPYTEMVYQPMLELLAHTDAVREWAYDRTSSIGKLDKGLDEAAQRGWTVVDMKKDWKQIYPSDK